MTTKLLMTSSAAFLAVLGVGFTFLPQELLAHVGAQPEWIPVLLIQLLGALCLGVASLNWMSRASLIGGIYGRPVSMTNFFTFAVGALALLKGLFARPFEPEVAAVAAIYSAFGIWFGFVLFTNPEAANRGQA